MSYQNAFEFELMKLVEEKISVLTENLTHSGSVVDYSEYKHQIGKIAALREVADLCEEANRILSSR